jgi:hypothetical protein
MHRLNGDDRRHADACAPDQEFLPRPIVGLPRVWIPDIGGEKNSRSAAKRARRRPAMSAGSAGEVTGTSWFMRHPCFQQIDETPKRAWLASS